MVISILIRDLPKPSPRLTQVPPDLSEGVWVSEAARLVEVGPGRHAGPALQREAREVAPTARHFRSVSPLSEKDESAVYNCFI